MTSAWALENSNLVPVLKKGKDKTNPSSYRPISLPIFVGELMERVITRRLVWFPETNNIFSPSQTGCSQHLSTEDQLALLTQDIENSFQERQKRPVKGVRPGVKKRTSVETAESTSFRPNAQIDQQLLMPQNGQGDA